MFQEIINKLKVFSFHRVLNYIKSYTTKIMDSTKVFNNDMEITNVRKRSVPESFIQDNLHNEDLNLTKKAAEDTFNTKRPNGYYKENACNGENKYGKNIYVS